MIIHQGLVHRALIFIVSVNYHEGKVEVYNI